jgi:uncharacterized protein YjbI with pentapeptide repeats
VNSDLTRTRLVDADLRDVDFAGANLFKTRFEGVRAHGVRGQVSAVTGSWAVRIDMSEAGDGSELVDETRFFHALGADKMSA